MNRLLLDALQCQNRGRKPIWLMRQAGRYLPEYQKIRKNHRLLDLFHNVDAICEVTLLPRALGVDAAILFSDILSVLDGLGIRWDFAEGEGPVVEAIVSLDYLQRKAPKEAYPHIREAIIELKKQLDIPLLGFAGAPFTVASYLIEGGSSKDFRKTKRWMYADPASFHLLLDKIADASIDYLKWQIEAGADAVQLFDSWAHTLSPSAFREYALPPLRKIAAQIEAPLILFCKGTFLFAEDLAALKPAAISCDWSGDISFLRQTIPSDIALQGNLDPALLYAPKEKIKQAAAQLLTSMHSDPGYIFNLGHGLLPDTPVDHVHYLVDYVRNHA